MRLSFEERVFAVTGAAQGIGAAIVHALYGSRATVAAIDIDPTGLAALAGDRISRHTADLGRRRSAAAAIAEVVGRHGRLDGLVTAAGGVRGQTGRPLEDVSADDWRAIFGANVDAAMWCAQAAAPALKAVGAGRNVTISSGAGLHPSLTGIQAYAAAKHALVGLTRQLALKLGPHGVTVNSVAPGLVLSNPATRAQREALGPDGQRDLVAGIHTRRLGRAEDIADAVLFLASDRAAWITGQVLSVDGGHA